MEIRSIEHPEYLRGINENAMSDVALRNELKLLYQCASWKPVAWSDPAAYEFITIHLIETAITRFAQELQGRLIDVGCGSQPYRSHFKHVTTYTGCDISADRSKADFLCPADRIPVEAESYDSILCTEVLEHVPDPLEVMREFRRILVPGGRVLITVPMFWPAHEQPWDFRRFPGHGLLHLAYAAGFRVDHLVPRGGKLALVGQVLLTAFQRYFRPTFIRRAWNELVLFLDSKNRNPILTLGWAVMLTKI